MYYLYLPEVQWEHGKRLPLLVLVQKKQETPADVSEGQANAGLSIAMMSAKESKKLESNNYFLLRN